MIDDNLFLVIICVLAALSSGGGTWLLLVLADEVDEEQGGKQFGENFVPVIELGKLMGVSANLALLAVIAAALGVFFFLNFLQGAKFSTVFIFVSMVVFLFSAKFLSNLNTRRQLAEFEDQLPIVVDQMVASMRAGRTLTQSFQALPAVLDEPASTEIFEIADRAQRGVGLDEALSRAGEKYDSKNYSLLLAVFKLFFKQGGNVIQPLQKMSSAFKALIRSEEIIRTASAEGKMNFVMINFAMLFMFSFLSLAAPSMLSEIFDTRVGVLALIVGVAVYIGGSIWMWKIMSVDI